MLSLSYRPLYRAGMDDVIAPDAEWIYLSYHDYDSKQMEKRGRVAISLSILPWDEAQGRPAGEGQSAPNENPFLPPPFGRMAWSFNPLHMMKELCGPGVVRVFLCLLCCTCCMGFLFFFLTYASGVYGTYELLTNF